MPYTSVTSDHIAELTRIVGVSNLSVAHADLNLRSHDESNHPPHLAEVIVWLESAQQVTEILQYANAHHIPVTPWEWARL